MGHSAKKEPAAPRPKTREVGLVAEFHDPHQLVDACDRARQAGYKKMDAYSPFPVHGIDPAIGIRRTRLPFFVLAVGLSGCLFALAMQYYTNKVDDSPLFPGYRFLISGKPDFSLPANIPVTFEVIVLSSAFATFFGMWALNRLPRFANPLHRLPRFRRVTNDLFFLMIEHDDPKFDAKRTRQQMEEWGADAVEVCEEDLTDQQLPKVIRMAGIVLLFLLLLPPALIFRAAGQTSRLPRLHVVPDMDWQDKFKTQTVSPNLGSEDDVDFLYGDRRTMRKPLPGTFARGDLILNTELTTGVKAGSAQASAVRGSTGIANTNLHSAVSADKAANGQPTATTPGEVFVTSNAAQQDPAATTPPPTQEPQTQNPVTPSPADGGVVAANEPDWVDQFPEGVEVSLATLNRGQARFEIYCSVCHGFDGNGGGLVNQRALALNVTGKAAWTAAKSLHDPAVKVQPVGRIFDTISNGRGTMGPYHSQIPVADRWAITMYVKALQETGIQPETPVVNQ